MAFQSSSPKIPQLENISVWYDLSNKKCFNPDAAYGGQGYPYPIPDTPGASVDYNHPAFNLGSKWFEKNMGVWIKADFSHLTTNTSGPYPFNGIRWDSHSAPYLGLRDLSGNERALALMSRREHGNSRKNQTIICPIKGKWYFDPHDLYNRSWHSAYTGHYIASINPDGENDSDIKQFEQFNSNFPGFSELEEIGLPLSEHQQDRFESPFKEGFYADKPYQFRDSSGSSSAITEKSARGRYWLGNWEGWKDKYGLVAGRPASANFAIIMFGSKHGLPNNIGTSNVNGSNNWYIIINGRMVASRNFDGASTAYESQGALRPGDVVDCDKTYWVNSYENGLSSSESKNYGKWEIGPPILFDMGSQVERDNSDTWPDGTRGRMQAGVSYHPIRPYKPTPNQEHEAGWPDPKYTPGQFHNPDPRLILKHENSVKIENVRLESLYDRPTSNGASDLYSWDHNRPGGIDPNGDYHTGEINLVGTQAFVVATGLSYKNLDKTNVGDAFYSDDYFDYMRAILIDPDLIPASIDFSDTLNMHHVYVYTSAGVLALHEIVHPELGDTDLSVKGNSQAYSDWKIRARQFENKKLLIENSLYTIVIVPQAVRNSYANAEDIPYPPVEYPDRDLPGFISLNNANFGVMGLSDANDPRNVKLFDDPKQPFVGRGRGNGGGDVNREFGELNDFSIFTWVRKTGISSSIVANPQGDRANAYAPDGEDHHYYYSPIVSASIHHFEFVFNNKGELQFHMYNVPGQRGSWEDATGDFPNLNVLKTPDRVMWDHPEWVFVGVTYSASANEVKLFVNGEKKAEHTASTLYPIGGDWISGDSQYYHSNGIASNDGNWGDIGTPYRLTLGNSANERSLWRPDWPNVEESTSRPYTEPKYSEMHMSQFYMWHDTIITEPEAKELFTSTKGRFCLPDLDVPSVLPGASAINSNLPDDQTDGGGGGGGGGDTTTTQPIYETITNLIQNYDEDTPSGVVAEALEDAVNGAGVRVLAVVDKNRQIEKLEKINSIADLPQAGSSNSFANDYGTGWNDSHFSANIELGEIANFNDVDLDGKKYLGIAGFHGGQFLGVTFLIFNDQSNSTMDDPVNVIDLINHNEMTASSAQLGNTRAFQIEGFTYDVNPGNNNSIASPDIIKTTTLGTSQSWILSTNAQLNAGADGATSRPNYYNQTGTKDVLSKDDGIWAWQAGMALQGNGTQYPLSGGYGVANFNNTDGTQSIKAFWGTDSVWSSFRYYIFT